MTKIPKKLKHCPIAEAMFEIRFETNYPENAVFGIVYNVIKESFKDMPIVDLPNHQVPEELRLINENLKFSPLHRIMKDNFSLSIGPRVLTFGCHQEYAGWSKWSEFINLIINQIQNTGILENSVRLGLRYINVFDKNILENTKIDLKLNGNLLLAQPTNLRTELVDPDGLIKILQVGNAINIVSSNVLKVGSIIDIDCIYNLEKNSFNKSYEAKLNNAHIKEKELFFSLLNENALALLGPIF